jgi:predicted aldo/keto reductase-like oxidoreductase
MLSYGYMPRGSSQVWSARMTQLRDDCLAKAHEAGMGIVAMKVIGGGWLGRWSGYLVPGFDKQRLAQLPGAAIRHVLQDKRVQLSAIGMHLKSQIDANIKIVSSGGACTAQDQTLLSEFSAKLYETDTVKKFRVE